MKSNLLLVALVGSVLAPAGAAAQTIYRDDGGYYPENPYPDRGFAPAPVLREFTDRDGNRVFVDERGEVVSVVPPAGPAEEPDWGQRGRTDWGVRRNDYGYRDRFQRGPDLYRDHNDFYGEGEDPYRRAEPQEQVPRDYGGLNEGPRPYTPPTAGDQFEEGQAAPADNGASGPSAEVAALQVFLDREGLSPGVIDGRMGSNVEKALAAYEVKSGSTLDADDIDGIMEALSLSGGLPISRYTITAEDIEGPFLTEVPTDYGEKAALDHLSYVSVAEKLAERFHMSEDYLRAINPNADFSTPGTVIKVAAVGSDRDGSVRRIVADKSRKQVLAYDGEGRLVAAYPATIGSAATPSPSGTHEVERIALDPQYTYNPTINFKQGDNDRILTIPPGPNGPVGSVWIALSKPTYGIHGTPEPDAIGKSESNGCIRLTNWDARELAGMVEAGVEVTFMENDPVAVAGE